MVIPSQAEVSGASVQAVVTGLAPASESSSSPLPVADVSVVDAKFIDPNHMVAPCKFVYTAPEATVYNTNGIPIAADVKVIQESKPIVAKCVVVQSNGSSGEVTVDYSDSDETTTDVWVSEKITSAINCENATHLNFF